MIVFPGRSVVVVTGVLGRNLDSGVEGRWRISAGLYWRPVTEKELA